MGGELYLYVVYGFREPNRWISFDSNTVLPVSHYTNDFSGSDVIYGVHAKRVVDQSVNAQFLLECQQTAETTPVFVEREKPLMDHLARARGCEAEWIVAIGGEFDIYATREESDGYDSDVDNSNDANSVNDANNVDDISDSENEEQPYDAHYERAMETRHQRRKLIRELVAMWTSGERGTDTTTTSGNILVLGASTV